MYARTTTVRGDPRAVDDGIAFIRNDVWPMVERMDGCIGMSMLADREAGRCIVTTAWADEDAMRASADAVRESRRQAAEVMRAEAVDIAEWEIAVLHRSRPAGDAACVRGTWVDIPAGQVDGMIDAFRMSLLPRLEDLPGFCSVSLLVDRPGQRGVAAVTYEDRAALERTREQGAAIREEFSRATGSTITEVAEFDLAMAHLHVPEMA
ncbi:antibiotic biosynthesis monooxygenase [Geodermatophilus poikilotrophus]|uniref:Antibiotic biosynthesis monooxygenase n=1 Tax=Geodermatophilus poikilotrophus TaxID=1333667 RepID=A0A1H9ZH51_9ACTN|nr:antibiotic biosynthesis monooxygenase [Geodermatophilus poikilotrophus]SES80928.1 Antibiotic biosynthesis monooxygenase [Geodermatophilus poikilotrophus]